MKKSVLVTFVSLLVALALPACVEPQSSLKPVVTDSDSVGGLLEGQWSGVSNSEGPGGPGRNDVDLRVENGVGQFVMGSGHKWSSALNHKSSGVVNINFGLGTREFQLKKNESGKLFLKSEYKASWNGEIRSYSVVLRKQ